MRAASGSLLLALGLLLAHLVLPALASAEHWVPQNSGTDETLWAVACPSASICYAVGDNGTIRKTTNGGTTWTGQSSGTSNNLRDVSCPSTSTCYAVGESGTIRKTADGGTTWAGQPSGTSNNLRGVSCPSTSTCYAVGESGTIRKTTDGGASWIAQDSGTSRSLNSVDCPTISTCYTVAHTSDDVLSLSGTIRGTIRKTTDGGASWSAQDPGPTGMGHFSVSCPSVSTCYTTTGYRELRGILATTNGGATWSLRPLGAVPGAWRVSCLTTSTCYAFGNYGTIRKTTDGWATWSVEDSGTSEWLRDVSCLSPAECWAVGADGTIITKSAPHGDPVADLLPDPPDGDWSETCTAPDADVADGFAGPTYVKLRVQHQSADETWVCFRVNHPDTAFGGRLDITGAMAEPPSHDEESGACTAESDVSQNAVPGDHPIRSGEVGDPSEPPHASYMIDAFADADRVWFCLEVGDVHRRVVVPLDGQTPPGVTLLPDNPPVDAPAPPSPPEGYPSAGCQEGEASEGGEHDTALNMGVGGDMHVWLESWQRSSQHAKLCVRLQGPIAIGGAFTVDATASPGIEVIATPGDDMAACPTNVISDDQADIEVKRSPQGQNPASICVRQGNEVNTVTAGTEGELTPPVVAWQPDPDALP